MPSRVSHLTFSFLLVLLAFPSCTVGQDTGERVNLRATNELGVPLHDVVGGGAQYDRVPDGATAEVLERARDGRWLKIRVSDGRTGWVSERYVDQTSAPSQVVTQEALSAEAEVWGSPEGCRRVIASGDRMDRENDEAIRIGTWNVRWFPRGCSSNQDCPENATNVDWLACTITWMDLDVLAVQEILATEEANDRMDDLLRSLNRLTEGDWVVDLQECGAAGYQHVGFLWNRERVGLSGFADAAQLNGAFEGSNPCAGNLRPGRYARAEVPGGVDFHVASVHFDSGIRDRDYEHRRTASRSIPGLQVKGEVLLATDADVVVLGDLNTMGQQEPSSISAKEEISILDEELGRAYRRVRASPNCTEYYRGHGGTLDHVVVSTGMQEAAANARVTGYCAVLGCADLSGDPPAAAEQLSDHCPVVFEITNEDLD